MKLHHITISNFRSFKGEQTFHFPSEPGLYFMQGINELEPRLEGNGTGKSTIWEAMLWCLFGKTSRGLKAGDVCNWDASKGTRVELAYQTEEGISLKVVTRTWGPNTWTLTDLFNQVIDLTDDKNSQLVTDFGLEFAPFLSSILMAQAQPMFLDLKAEQQASMFGDVLSLDCWLDWSVAAGKMAGKHDLEVRRLEREQSTLRGELEGQQDFTKQIEFFEQGMEAKLRDIEDKHKKGVAQLRELKDALQGRILADGVSRDNLARNQEALMQANEKQQALSSRCLALGQERRDVEVRQEQQLTLLDFLTEHEHCPTCDQDIDPKVKRTKIAAATAEAKHFDVLISKVEHSLEAENAKFKKASAEVQLLTNKNDALRLLVRATENDVKLARTDVAMKERYLDDLERQGGAALAETNPFKTLQQEASERRRRLQNSLRDTQILLDRANEAYSLATYWIKGFKEVRLHLIAEALTELEIEVNSSVTELGLVGWELRFQVDRENKTGGISRGFSVSVLSPSNPKPVPWFSWSGGESQRLRIAANMGMANLIRSRSGTQLDLEVWDEPSTALSPQGVQDLLETLRRRAKTEERVIWVVDHTAYSFGGFTGGAMITKTEAGSTIAVY